MIPKSVNIIEVGPRDGLQNESKAIPLEKKLDFIKKLSDSGLKSIEAGAFVSQKWVPQMADSDQVFQSLNFDNGIQYFALVPNLKGLERALESGAKDIAIFTAATESFSQKNTNCSIDDSFIRIKEILDRTQKEKLKVRAHVSTSFVCPYEGVVDPKQPIEVSQRLLDLGVEELVIADTIGQATPLQIRSFMELYQGKGFPVSKIAMHFHDTYGFALANVWESLQFGVSSFDSSVGGLGGCPYAPGASGNLATEKLLSFLDKMNIETGVSYEKIKTSPSALD